VLFSEIVWGAKFMDFNVLHWDDEDNTWVASYLQTDLDIFVEDGTPRSSAAVLQAS